MQFKVMLFIFYNNPTAFECLIYSIGRSHLENLSDIFIWCNYLWNIWRRDNKLKKDILSPISTYELEKYFLCKRSKIFGIYNHKNWNKNKSRWE